MLQPPPRVLSLVVSQHGQSVDAEFSDTGGRWCGRGALWYREATVWPRYVFSPGFVQNSDSGDGRELGFRLG